MRLSGPSARAVAAALTAQAGAARPREATRVTVLDAQGSALDEGLMLVFPGPQSYTGEDVVELHLHGSPVVVRETIAAALAAGARLAEPGEFTRRAFHAGKLDLAQAEAVADLIDAESRSAARAARARLAGGLIQAVDAPRARLRAILEELSGTLDYPEEIPEPPRERLVEEVRAVRAALALLEAGAEVGRLVREGATAALVGPPNAGKSSLLNALLGEDRALVSEEAGTTRDTIEETLGLGDIVLRLIDTAGIRTHADRLEAAGIARTHRALADARLAIIVIDGSVPLDPIARDLLHQTRARPRLVVFTKRDLGTAPRDADGDDVRDALSITVHDAGDVARVRTALRAAVAFDTQDLEQPHLASARQLACVYAARTGLDRALETLRAGAPVDLIAADCVAAFGALGELRGDGANEAILDGVFARFCVGK